MTMKWHRCDRWWKRNLRCPLGDLKHEAAEDSDPDHEPPEAIPIPSRRKSGQQAGEKDEVLDDPLQVPVIKEVEASDPLIDPPTLPFPPVPIPPPLKKPDEVPPIPVAASSPAPSPWPIPVPPNPQGTGVPGPPGLIAPGDLRRASLLESALAGQSASEMRRRGPSLTGPPLRPNESTLRTLTSLKNAGQWTRGQESAGIKPFQVAKGVPRPRGIRVQAPIENTPVSQYDPQDDPGRSERRLPSPVPIPPVIGRKGGARRGGRGGFSFNFSRRLRFLMGQQGFGQGFKFRQANRWRPGGPDNEG